MTYDCSECGPVVHQPIPDDSAHCGCHDGQVAANPQAHNGDYYRPCPCGCHEELV